MNQTTAPLRETKLRDEPPQDAPREFVVPPSVTPGGIAPDRLPVPVKRPAGVPEPGAAGAGAWIVAWGEIVLLGVLAVIGAFFASANASPGDYTCGVVLIVAAVALAFLRLKARFDGPSTIGTAERWSNTLLVDDWANLTAVVVIFVILGLIGLFLAAGHEYGGLHYAGLALFVVSGAAIFLNLKHVFDIRDRGVSDHGG